jgi:hypothetical protein
VYTPEAWLRIQPFVELRLGARSLVIVQPTTSALVYLLGLVAIGAGLHFLRIRRAQRSRVWWGIALVLWGLGALLAGTSYEAFSYYVKCAGREVCAWTSWWEIGYLVVSVASVDAMLIAQAYSCATGKLRAALTGYALANLALYLVTILIGAFVPVPFLISFEWLLVVSAPTILIFILHNALRYYRRRRGRDLALLGAWLWLALTIAAYFLYLISGLTGALWARRIWFSENDVLHIGLIVWMVYLALVVATRVEDERPAESLARVE